MDKNYILNTKLNDIMNKYPFIKDFLENNNFIVDLNKTLNENFNLLSYETIEDNAINIDNLSEQLLNYIQQMLEFLGETQNKLKKLTIIAGNDKEGKSENFNKIEIKPGDIISIVGPTGSGKSRLLGDIEWVAQKDTPTKRQILLNDEIPDKKWRFSPSEKLVAQLSQNMNFVMDLTVKEFLELHAQSRLIDNSKQIIKNILNQANDLAGEKFNANSPITGLSGGQSRALMIADTALLSKSPIVLIDEIENAGIDRKKALNLLLSQEKIILIATHDPVLALMAHKRLIIKNGGINKIINITNKERKILSELEKYDKIMQNYRQKLRFGEILGKNSSLP